MIITKNLFFLFTLLFAYASSQCASGQPLSQNEKSGNITTADVATQNFDNNIFGLNVYASLKNLSENIVFSPFSISSTFVVIYGGAVGDTQNQMKNVLQYSLKPEYVPVALNQMTRMLTSYNRDMNPDFRLAFVNSLWFQSDFLFLPNFMNAQPIDFKERIRFIHFDQEPELSRKQINRSVLERTYGRLSEILPPKMITTDTKLVLVTGISLKARWQNVFNSQNTHQAPFFPDARRTFTVPMMENTGSYSFLKTDAFSLLEIPYAPLYSSSLQLSLFVLLPNQRENLAQVEQMLSMENIETWLKQMKVQNVHVSIPKFQMGENINLKDLLKQMGMPSVFSQDANFSKMTNEKIHVDQAVHKAFFLIDELGTEISTPPQTRNKDLFDTKPPVLFRADHPFLFFIMEKSTGTILLLGRLKNPL